MKAKSSHSQFMLLFGINVWGVLLKYKLVQLQVVIQPLPSISVQENRWKDKEWRGLDVWIEGQRWRKGTNYLPSPLTVLGFHTSPSQIFCSSYFQQCLFLFHLYSSICQSGIFQIMSRKPCFLRKDFPTSYLPLLQQSNHSAIFQILSCTAPQRWKESFGINWCRSQFLNGGPSISERLNVSPNACNSNITLNSVFSDLSYYLVFFFYGSFLFDCFYCCCFCFVF